MKQMKRALAAALAAALLAGCAGQEAGQSASALPASESAAQTDGAAVEQLLNGEHILNAAPRGYQGELLAQNGQGDYRVVDRFVCYTDYTTGVREPLCDVAGCTHKDENCPAFTPYSREVALAGDWVLTCGRDADGTYSLDVRRPDGGDKKVLFSGLGKISFHPLSASVEGDRIWLAMEGKAVLLDPETGETEEGAELPEEFAGGAAFGSGLLHGFSDGKELLEEYYQPSGDLKADMQQQEEILSEATFTESVWDPRTGKEVPLLSWDNGKWQSLSCWNNKEILFSKAQGRFEAWDLATGETTVLAENWPENQFIVVGCVWDDHLMLETMWKAEPDNIDTWRECLFALDLAGGGLTEITLRNQGGDGTRLPRILGESESEFYVIRRTPGEGGAEGGMAMISKADYYAGVDSMRPIQNMF
ncbi:MAG TPA: hypothetical protein H9770_07365 [Candidatus Fournierella excrementigallinarum]|nr:hypothetical protein [Candidatus Fournierella excrementigallinarum]